MERQNIRKKEFFMEDRSLWYGDLHLHTNLSNCAPRETVPETYLPFLVQEDVRTVGFSNHLYYTDNFPDEEKAASDVPGVQRVLKLKDNLAEFGKKNDLRVLFGCEVETVFGREPSLPKELAGNFDYILIAASHVLNIRQYYRDYDLSTPEKLRDLVIERFEYACNIGYPVPTGICHPLYPICSPVEQEIVDGISDSRLADCFTLAAKKNISIEIHACLYRKGTHLDEENLSPSYIRLLSAAKACGCHFHFGSDAHCAEAFVNTHSLLRRAAERAGITKEDMWKI